MTTRDDFVAIIEEYDARIRYVDAQVERLYGAIEAASLPGSTLWILTADHGEGLASHEFKGHGKQLYQEQLHVPLLLASNKDGFPRQRVDALVSSADLAWTIRAWWGQKAELPPGRALLPGLPESGPAIPGRIVYSERRPVGPGQVERGWTDERVTAAQTGRLKYIDHSGSSDEAYQLDVDPLERRNLLAPFASLATGLHQVLGDRGAEPRLQTPSMDAELAEELRALGYAE